MNINYKEPQFELFPANSATLEDINKPKFLLASLTLSTESLVILVILGIMIALFSFSIGVERGKHLSAQALDEKVAAAWNVGGRRLAPVAAATPAVAPAVNQMQASTKAAARNPKMPVQKAVAAPAAAATAASAAASGKWAVQLATYKNEKYAQQEALGIKAKGYPVFIIKSKDFYLVCLGPLSSQSQADDLAKKVRPRFQGSQVRRI